MRKIEFIGAMGSGKSTLCQELVSLSSVPSGRILCGDLLAKKSYLLALKAHRFGLKRVISELMYYIPPARNRFFLPADISDEFGVADSCRLLVDYVMKNYQGVASDPALSLKRVLYFYITLGQFSSLSLLNDESDVAVFDEFLLQRCLAFSLWHNDYRGFIDGYIELTPISDLVVAVNTPVDLVCDRVEQREGGHTKMEVMQASENQQYMVARLIERGCNVVELDGSESTKKNLRRIVESRW